MNTTNLNDFLAARLEEFDQISDDRKQVLETLTSFVEDRIQDAGINLIFICVHNSRRSHLSQVWAQIAAAHFGFHNVHCYSGGTEVTAMYPTIGETLVKQGIDVLKIKDGENPIYAIKSDVNAQPLMAFSKLYDDRFNPQSGFGAIMVCSTADNNCPYISTAAKRILIPFEDPKAFDGKPEQAEKYAERSAQIAREFLYAFSRVNRNN